MMRNPNMMTVDYVFTPCEFAFCMNGLICRDMEAYDNRDDEYRLLIDNLLDTINSCSEVDFADAPVCNCYRDGGYAVDGIRVTMLLKQLVMFAACMNCTTDAYCEEITDSWLSDFYGKHARKQREAWAERDAKRKQGLTCGM